jgi:hypothetical protein
VRGEQALTVAVVVLLPPLVVEVSIEPIVGGEVVVRGERREMFETECDQSFGQLQCSLAQSLSYNQMIE